MSEHKERPRRFVFGRRRILLEAVEKSASVDTLLPILPDAVCLHSLRPLTLASLSKIRNEPSTKIDRIENILRSSAHWSFHESLVIANWLHENGSGAWRRWAEAASLFPEGWEHLPSRFQLALLQHCRPEPLPAESFLPSAFVADLHRKFRLPLSSEESLHASCLRFLSSPSSVDEVRQLLTSAASAGLQSVVATLFEGSWLCALTSEGDILKAFHTLDWSRYGLIKIDFARRSRPLQGRYETPDSIRFAAIQFSSAGRHEEALTLLRPHVKAVGQPAAREYFMVWLETAPRPDKPESDLVGLLAEDPSGDLSSRWLKWLLDMSRARSFSGTLREIAEETDLPPASDPVFALVAAGLLRAYSTRRQMAGGAESWEAVEKRLCSADPLWRMSIPIWERAYAQAYDQILASDADAHLLAVCIRKVLLLPVQLKTLKWIQSILHLLQTDARAELFEDTFGSPTELGSLVLWLCIRVVRFLEKRIDIEEESAAALCSAVPSRVCSVLSIILSTSGVELRRRVAVEAVATKET